MPLQNNTTPKKHYQPGKQIEHIYEVAQMIENTNEKTTQKPKKKTKIHRLRANIQTKIKFLKLANENRHSLPECAQSDSMTHTLTNITKTTNTYTMTMANGRKIEHHINRNLLIIYSILRCFRFL